MDQAAQSMIRNLEEKTGRTIAEWVGVTRGLGDLKHGQLVKALKEQHGLTHGYANLVVHVARESPALQPRDEDVDLVAAQYAGAKEALRSIYDAVAKAVIAFGPDVELAPKKAYVSLRRSKQFALVQPSTKTRVDVGIKLKGVAPKGRLEASGSFNSMVSHRVKVSSPSQVDAELVAWLREAYDQA